MRTIDGYWRPGRKKAEELLSTSPTVEEKEKFINVKLSEVFKNQVGDFTIFKAEMLDHFLLSIEEQVTGDTKEDFCKAYYKTYKELGGALMVRSMGYHSMHMSYRKLHRGFLYWWMQNKIASVTIFFILAINWFIFDLNDIAIKYATGFCLLIITAITFKSFYSTYYSSSAMRGDDLILSSYRFELRKVFYTALSMYSVISLTNWLDIPKIYALIVLMPLTHLLVFYYLYVESKIDDLTSKRSAL